MVVHLPFVDWNFEAFPEIDAPYHFSGIGIFRGRRSETDPRKLRQAFMRLRLDDSRPRLLLREEGSVMAEYAVLLGLVAVGCSLAVVGLGAPLVRAYLAQELWLLLAVP